MRNKNNKLMVDITTLDQICNEIDPYICFTDYRKSVYRDVRDDISV